eukprot:TRINITY_DN5943_c0_g1_i1.p1 TRINITY_DN5943_c0_g1~~TRINITY_DN5943_c0_g1_i1.p1  ORF type:complete len:444 (+),score=80.93 TRINITY_DN5943_c0_g1_i1:60-1334(+)
MCIRDRSVFILEKWIILILSCLVLLGDYYTYDVPLALKGHLSDAFNQYSETRFNSYFNLLYSIYSFPNVILPLIGGMLVNRYGYMRMLVILSFLIAFGNFVLYIGVFNRSFPIMIIGRFLYGLGGDNVTIAQWTLVQYYFTDEDLGKVLGTVLALGNLGAGLNMFLTPKVAESSSLEVNFFINFAICTFSFVMMIFVYFLDKSVERKLPPEQSIQPSIETTGIFAELRRIWKESKGFFSNRMFTLLLIAHIFILIAYNGFSYVTYDIINELLYSGKNEIAAESLNDTLWTYNPTILIFLYPLFGYLRDRFHLLKLYAFLGVTLLGFGFLSFLYLNPWIAISIVTVGESWNSCFIWILLAEIVTREQISDASGIFYSCANIAIMICPFINLLIKIAIGKWGFAAIVYSVIAFVALIPIRLLYKKT